jgi:hypothetical protein
MRKLRARRAILLGLVLFALSQEGIVVGDWPSLRDPCYGRKLARLKQRLTSSAGQDRPLCVVQIGSSRTIFGLRGQVAEPWLSERLGRPVVLFNMGFTAAGPITNRINLQRLLNAGVRPDLVVLEVLPRGLADEKPLCELLPQAFPASRLRHDEMRTLCRHAGRDRPGLRREWWLAQAAPLHTYRFSLLARITPTLLPASACVELSSFENIDDSGWVEIARLSPEQVQRSLNVARQSYEPILRSFRLSRSQVAVVRETIALARQAGVKTALVLMPEGPIFRSWYPAAAWRQIDTALKELSRRLAERLVPLLHQGEPSPSSRQEVRLR